MAKETIREKESKTDIAYRIMTKKKKEKNFYEIWDEVKAELAKTYTPEELEKVEEDISFFYTSLTLDGRFVNVGDNKFDLRERVTFDKVHIDMNEIYAEEEADEAENEEDSQYVSEDYDESFDDSTGSDADIEQYRERNSSDEDDEEE